MPMRCPYCGSVVEPARDTSGALFCPACQNSGTVAPVWPPPARPAGARGPAPSATPPPASTRRKAVTAVVLALLAIGLVTALLLFGGLSRFKELAGSTVAERVQMGFDVESDGAGGILRLSTVSGLEAASIWGDFELGGTAQCTLPGGAVDVGDEIVCVTDGDVVLIDWGEDQTVYATTV
ncbi:MAG TPA: hypothetical protein VM327_06760 [Candidatus Thermoplasmatota archaeon]|nr:hypothetical protein [Candidatus Thermoplasmatota archaeon]